jgi:hypothetical protein
MLTTVLDRLTTLTSRYFIVGAFIPILVFGFINGAFLYKEFAWFKGWAQPQISGTARAFDLAAILIGIAVVAYVLWSLNGFLRQVLEGAHLHPHSKLGRYLKGRQSACRRKLREEYYEARDTTAGIGEHKTLWQKRLSTAAREGQKIKRNDYDGRNGEAAKAINALRQQQEQAIPPTLTTLEGAVIHFETVLTANNLSFPPEEGMTLLARDRLELLKLFDYAKEEWEAREVALASQLQARFGVGAIAPTAFGNIAESMQSYAFTRYRMNLTTFWSRLQPVLQKKSDSYGVLQDVKLQLDFLVACIWLASLTTLLWLIVLPVSNHVGWLVFLVAVVGPLTTWLFYRAAVESYVGFGEVVRTSVDLYRLELLDALHIRRPSGLREERVVWQALQGVVSYGQEWVDVSYSREATK